MKKSVDYIVVKVCFKGSILCLLLKVYSQNLQAARGQKVNRASEICRALDLFDTQT